jgi:hypothetical protein
MRTSKKPTPLLVALALALGALGVSLLLRALFFPPELEGVGTPAAVPGVVDDQGRRAPAPASRRPPP